MPPSLAIAGAFSFSFSFFSTTTHSVVSSSLAMDAAFCRAVRVTWVGDDAGRDQILVLVGLGVVAVVTLGRFLHLSAFWTIIRIGSSSARRWGGNAAGSHGEPELVRFRL